MNTNTLPTANRRAVDPAQSDALNAYIALLDHYPRVSPTRERQLAVRTRAGDLDARNQLVEANLRLVIAIARDIAKESHTETPLMDIIQEGNVGLLIAADRFEPERGLRFSTYAGWWIRKYCLNAAKAERVRTVSLNKAVGVRTYDHYNANSEGGSVTLGDLIADPATPMEVIVSDHEETQDLMAMLYEHLSALSARERTVLTLHYGLGSEDGEHPTADGGSMTLEQIGKRLRLHRATVGEIERVALMKLRAAMMAQEAPEETDTLAS